MRNRLMVVGMVGLSALLLSGLAGGDCPPCGDLQCLNDPAFPPLRQQKKDKLTKSGFAPERVALVDNDGPCRLCLSNAPDWFSLLVRRPNGAIEVKTWTAEQEAYAKKDLGSGAASEAYVMYAQKRCACCGEKKPEDRPDWNAKLQMSTSLAIKLQP